MYNFAAHSLQFFQGFNAYIPPAVNKALPQVFFMTKPHNCHIKAAYFYIVLCELPGIPPPAALLGRGLCWFQPGMQGFAQRA